MTKFNHENITYNPLQEKTQHLVHTHQNVIVLAPTSSGKTVVAEQFLNSVERGLYLSPLKALTSEKLHEWGHVQGVVAITGDHKTHANLSKSPLILMTTEALDSKSRGYPSWLKGIDMVVVDEAHLIGVPRRGAALEASLIRSSTITKCPIIFLSATLPNPEDLSVWLSSLNGLPTQIVMTDWRPVKLTMDLVPIPTEKEWEFDRKALTHIKRALGATSGQTLIFVHSIAKGKKLSSNLGIPFHNSRLPAKRRMELEQAFRSRQLKALISTSTLAWGVNLPAENGVIVGAHRGYDRVETYDLKQMAGRIGRYGLASEGHVTILVKQSDYERVRNELFELPPVQSKLDEELVFHLCSVVERENVDPYQFCRRSLGWSQGILTDEKIAHALRLLETIPQKVRRAASLMYLDPMDLNAILRNFEDMPKTPTLIAKALSDIPSLQYDLGVPINPKIKWVDMPFTAQMLQATCLTYWLQGREVPQEISFLLNHVKSDVPRIIAGLRIAAPTKMQPYLKNLELSLVHGVEWDLTELVSIQGLGRVRARRLASLGIKTEKDLLNPTKRHIVQRVLGTALYNRIIAERKEGKVFIHW